MLGEKDKQILRELDLDSRQSITQIAKKARVSKETANYTIKKLEKEGLIDSYFSLVDYFKLGSNIFKLLIRYKDLGEKGEARMIKWLKNKNEVAWVGKTEGNWDLIITVIEEDVEKIYELLREFNKTFSIHIREKQLLISYEISWMNEKYLYGDSSKHYKISFGFDSDKVKVDMVDRKILSILEGNAREALVEIAGKVGLTAEGVANRIRNLIKKDLIGGFKLRTNLAKLGKGYHHIFISLNDFSKLDDVCSYYESSRNCVFLMKYHGSYDLHLEMVSGSEQEFREIIIELREKFGSSISDYQQLTVLQESIFTNKNKNKIII
jgi:DNA-binding Lrp family transcriptional regulator